MEIVPIAFVNSATTATTTAGTSTTLNMPANITVNNVLIAFLNFSVAVTGITGLAETGWSQFSWSPMTDGTVETCAVFYKTAVGGETVSLSWTNSAYVAGVVVQYSGVNPYSPIDTSAGSYALVGGSGGSLSTPTISASGSNEWAVAMFAARTSVTGTNNITFTAAPGLTDRAQINNSTATSPSTWVAIDVEDSNGTVSVGSHTYTATESKGNLPHNQTALIYLNPQVIKQKYGGLFPIGTNNGTTWTPPLQQVSQDFTWATLNPSSGTYDFTSIDNYLATYGVPGAMVRLHINGGYQSPTWLNNEVGTISVTNTRSGTTEQCPLYWVQTYMDAWKEFITALGNYYDNNPRIQSVNMAACSFIFDEPFILGSDTTSVQNMWNAGLTAANGQTAMYNGMAALINAFPTTVCEFAGHSSRAYPQNGVQVSDWNTTQYGGLAILNYLHNTYGQHYISTDYGWGQAAVAPATSLDTASDQYSWMHLRANLGYPIAFQLTLPAQTDSALDTALQGAVDMNGRWVEHSGFGLTTNSDVQMYDSELKANNSQTPSASSIDDSGSTDTEVFSQSHNYTDLSGLTDSYVVAKNILTVTQTDTGLSDSWTTTQSHGYTDLSGLTDRQAYNQGHAYTDLSGLTDTYSVQTNTLGIPTNATDNSGLTDREVYSQSHVYTDLSGLTDSTSFVHTWVITHTDLEALTDPNTVPTAHTLTVTDDSGLLDFGFVPFSKDLVGLTDSVVLVQSHVYTDLSGLKDSSFEGPVHYVTSTDLSGLTDPPALGQGHAYTDAENLTDYQAYRRGLVASDPAGEADRQAYNQSHAYVDSNRQFDSFGLGQSHAYTDLSGLHESTAFALAPVITDTSGLGDSPSLMNGIEATDGAGLTDNFAAVHSQDDQMGLTDSATWTLTRAVTDSTGTTDSVVFGRLFTDSVGSVDSLAQFAGSGSLDLAGLSDYLYLQQSHVYNDSAGLTDSSSQRVFLLLEVTETDSAGLSDPVARGVGYTDGVGCTDSVVLAQTHVYLDVTGITDINDEWFFDGNETLTATDRSGITDSVIFSHTIAATDTTGSTDFAFLVLPWTAPTLDIAWIEAAYFAG